MFQYCLLFQIEAQRERDRRCKTHPETNGELVLRQNRDRSPSRSSTISDIRDISYAWQHSWSSEEEDTEESESEEVIREDDMSVRDSQKPVDVDNVDSDNEEILNDADDPEDLEDALAKPEYLPETNHSEQSQEQNISSFILDPDSSIFPVVRIR